ncbi:Cleavage stimulation factor subunit 3 [Verticillium nonalfalfae]|uniref:mRNA 3'-end-processing protein RNA14 n=1 Tax=Verticillium nonalfalfae TaxID=1051616 RepID=A0A3M9YKG5_9PEZI|nr:Cleavage stimulation factor subunit 3 [Verticillium nonalfalfae]RNJ60452.1 Cleavage stimulation factor subunit 3 [Verticillium nonalfalfae]
MATPDPQENEQEFEGASWEEEEEDGYEGANETQHSDQKDQEPDSALAQPSHGEPEEPEDEGDDDEDGEDDGEDGEEDDQEDIEEQDEMEELEEQQQDDDNDGEGDGSDDGAEYDPESVSITPIPQITEPASAPTPTTAPAPAAPAKPRAAKPKVSGGFLVGDSDDEDDDAPRSNSALGQVASISRPQSALNVSTPNQGQVGASSTPVNGGPYAPPASVAAASAPAFATSASPSVSAHQTTTITAGRDPGDVIGRLEDRIKEDPRGDMDAWLALFAELRRLSQVDALRQAYDRFVTTFPQAADIWVEWIKLELDSMNTTAAEALFQRSLLTVSDVQLWTTYINYIRRRNDLSNDPNGQARQVISQSYEFIIDNVGMDRESGSLWKDWIQFIKSGPGVVGGPGWQDQQKMDQLRKAYHRAITVPMSALTELWKDYDQFELGLNKATGRQFIQKRSPGYMTAKSASLQMDRKIGNLNRTSLPRLPPAPGFAGATEYMEQVNIWKQWIQWEKEDPLVLADDEPEVLKQRILYVYKQALMALRFWPEMWVDAAEWCFENSIFKDGVDLGIKFLTDGIAANPESVLLALKHGDRIEMTLPVADTEESKEERAKAIREPYDQVLETLYHMMQKLKEREKNELAKIEKAATEHAGRNDGDDNDDQDQTLALEQRTQAVKQGFSLQTELLKRTISFIWIALCRAMRRTQGKGSQTKGLRQVFTEARGKGQLTSDVYVAVALIESVVYKDPAGGKIFDRGAKLFPEDEGFMLEYIKYLHLKDDTTNARVVFETCVNRLTQKPEKKHRAKMLYKYFHKYEAQFGELSSVAALERRMAELWPEDPKLSHFTERYSVDSFDPIAYRLIISPAVQLRPNLIMPSIEQATSVRDATPLPAAPPVPVPVPAPAPTTVRQTASPAPQYLGTTNSPKRPYPGDDQEEYNRPRKLARGQSPLKGAAGRRLDQQRQNQGAPLARDITFFLGILPPTHSYNAQLFSTSGLVNLLRDTPVPDYSTWKVNQDQGMRQNGAQSRGGPSAHGRQPSGGDYSSYNSFSGARDSPNPRPLSPYEGAAGRRIASQSAYRNSPLRPEPGATFEGSSGAYRQDTQQQFTQPPPGQWPPPSAPQFEGGAPSSWPPPPNGYSGYTAPPSQQYGQYQY